MLQKSYRYKKMARGGPIRPVFRYYRSVTSVLQTASQRRSTVFQKFNEGITTVIIVIEVLQKSYRYEKVASGESINPVF
jgi:hypothetical protein